MFCGNGVEQLRQQNTILQTLETMIQEGYVVNSDISRHEVSTEEPLQKKSKKTITQPKSKAKQTNPNPGVDSLQAIISSGRNNFKLGSWFVVASFL
jgi:hypothetical protein